MSHAAAFDDVMGRQASDWALLEVYVTLDEPTRLNEARVALARANARPLRQEGDHDFAITVANTRGHGARSGVVRSALATLDRLGITGHTWGGEAYSLIQPAPAHRAGP